MSDTPKDVTPVATTEPTPTPKHRFSALAEAFLSEQILQAVRVMSNPEVCGEYLTAFLMQGEALTVHGDGQKGFKPYTVTKGATGVMQPLFASPGDILVRLSDGSVGIVRKDELAAIAKQEGGK
jgi:hypothetical protein